MLIDFVVVFSSVFFGDNKFLESQFGFVSGFFDVDDVETGQDIKDVGN